METNVTESEDVFAESKGIQENRKLQDKGTVKPILPRTRRKLTRKEDFFNNDEARTNGGQDRGKQREGWFKTDVVDYVMKEIKPLKILLLDARSWQTVSTCQSIIEH